MKFQTWLKPLQYGGKKLHEIEPSLHLRFYSDKSIVYGENLHVHPRKPQHSTVMKATRWSGESTRNLLQDEPEL